MSRVDAKRRKHLIKVKQKRKRKLARLREEYLAAKTEGEKKKVFEKATKLAPWLSEKEFLTPIKEV
jgi:hypothetical protein